MLYFVTQDFIVAKFDDENGFLFFVFLVSPKNALFFFVIQKASHFIPTANEFLSDLRLISYEFNNNLSFVIYSQAKSNRIRDLDVYSIKSWKLHS